MNGLTGEEVLAIRQRLSLSQEEMAERIGVTDRTVRRWESEGCSEFVAKFLAVVLAQNDQDGGE